MLSSCVGELRAAVQDVARHGAVLERGVSAMIERPCATEKNATTFAAMSSTVTMGKRR